MSTKLSTIIKYDTPYLTPGSERYFSDGAWAEKDHNLICVGSVLQTNRF